MTTPITLYWSFRSPYSYLALKGVRDIAARRDVRFDVKIVHPLAIRQPDFFDSRGPEWMGYILRDILRLAQMTGQILAMPQPDPIVQDMQTAKIADDQPHIFRLAHLGVLACERGRGLDFISECSAMIWGGQDWLAALSDITTKFGWDLAEMDAEISRRATGLESTLDANDKALRKAGHWGVPTCVIDGEPFFGMDRLDAVEWRLDQMGVA